MMGRKTKSFSALACAAGGILSFTGLENAKALAQQTLAQVAVAEGTSPVGAPDAAGGDVTFERLEESTSEPTVFVSNEVVQDVPEEAEPAAASEAATLRELVGMIDHSDSLSDELHCLAGAVYFEARGEPLAGQLAVANVVINRAEDRRWPGSYCGVVYQPSQFSFVKNRRMPRIRTGSQAWKRAKAVAQIAHDDMWASPAGDAVYFHAQYVRPRWSRAKTRLAQIETHIFYR